MMPTTPCDDPAIRVIMMPRDTNPHGTIFGGVLLSYIDQAGAVAARQVAPHRYVTIAMDSVEFKEPVFIGDLVSLYTDVLKVGRTSIRIRVRVEAKRYADPRLRVPVTEATVTYVAVDKDQKKTAVRSSSGS